MERLFHLARVTDWAQAQRDGAYRVSTLGLSLHQVGFIHLSFAHQVKIVADRFYRGRSDLVLLQLDPARLDAKVVIEPVADSGDQFPHLYGEIRPEAVVVTRPYLPRSDGTFDAVE